MSSASHRTMDKDNIVQAVVIADWYGEEFQPLSSVYPPCLMPLANRPLLDYTLHSLSTAGVQECILFCSFFVDKIKAYISDKKWGKMVINVVVSDGCRSFGDAMRDLDAKALIRTDFILLGGNVIASLDLVSLLESHKKIQNTDKGAAMTVLYKPCGKKTRHASDKVYLMLDSSNNRILGYHKTAEKSLPVVNSDSKLVIPLEVLLERSCLDVRCDLSEAGVALCSVSVPPLFADNFDYQTRDDFVRGLLMNEEILASTVYARVLPPAQFSAAVTNWSTYHSISHDMIHRWTYPLVPDAFIDEYCSYRFGNIYLQNNITLAKGSNLLEDVIIGEGSSVSANTIISSSVIGKGCEISNNNLIEHSHLFRNTVTKPGVTLRECIVGDGCVLGENVSLTQCVLAPGVHISDNMKLNKLRLQPTKTSPESVGVCEGAWEWGGEECEEDSEEEDGPGEWVPLRLAPHPDTLSDSEDDESVVSHAASAPDDTNLFFSEVVDSLSRGLEDKLPCDNLVLEINSSRYAYNVSLREVNYHVVRAILSLEDAAVKWDQLKTVLNYFLPLLTNYIKNEDAMNDCLSAIEDVAEVSEGVRGACVKVLHTLYERDILSEEAIVFWHATTRDPSPAAQALRTLVKPFIKWLEEADEQSDSSED